MPTKNITNGIALDCAVFNESIGADKDLILINYLDFDLEQTASAYNRQVDNSLNNIRGLSDIFLKPGAIQYIFEGTDYSVVPTITPETREDGNIWFTHSIAFTVYSKKAQDRDTLLSLGRSKVIAVTKDRSTGLYELFGMYQGLRVTGIDRAYVGAQNSNFYQVTIATPEINVIKEPSLSELSIYLDGGTVLPPAPTPGIYGDATPIVQGLVRVDTLRPNPIVYTVESADFKFEEKNNKVTTAAQLELNKTSTVKYASLKAIVDWISALFEPILNAGTIGQYYRGDKTWQNLNAGTIGLENVDNTSDLDKPISNMTQLALEQIERFPLNTPNSTVTVGGYLADTPLADRTAIEVLTEMLVVYLYPQFNSQSCNYPSIVEVGTTVSGNRVFAWSISNAGNVKPNTVAIFDINSATNIATGLANDGSETVALNSILLNANNATQSWKIKAQNTKDENFESGNIVTTAKFKRFFGATTATPTTGTARGLDSEFQISNQFILNTGNTLTKFAICLPSGVTISSVIDLDALNLNITSNYVSLGTININDIGGTSRVYNLYEMNIGAPYSANHRHQITTI